jgi:hypothetical protein
MEATDEKSRACGPSNRSASGHRIVLKRTEAAHSTQSPVASASQVDPMEETVYITETGKSTIGRIANGSLTARFR